MEWQKGTPRRPVGSIVWSLVTQSDPCSCRGLLSPMNQTPQPIDRDEFVALYAPGQVLTSEGIRTSLAQERRKGRLVMVHELASSPGEKRRALNLLGQLGPTHRALVIGSYAIDEEPVIVTKFLLGFVSFRQWLEHAIAETSTVLVDTREGVSELDLSPHSGTPTHLAVKTSEMDSMPLNLESVPALEDTSVGMTPVPGTAPKLPPSLPPSLRQGPPEAPPPPRAPLAPVAEPAITSVAPALRPQAEPLPPRLLDGNADDFSEIFGKLSQPDPTPVREVAKPVPPVVSAPIASVPSIPVAPAAKAASPTHDDTPSYTEIFGGQPIPSLEPPLVEPRSDRAAPRLGDRPAIPPADASAPADSGTYNALFGSSREPPEPVPPVVIGSPVADRLVEPPRPKLRIPNVPASEPAAQAPSASGPFRAEAVPPALPKVAGPIEGVAPPQWNVPGSPPPPVVRVPSFGTVPAGPREVSDELNTPSGPQVESVYTEWLKPALPQISTHAPAPLPGAGLSAPAGAPKGASMTPVVIVLLVAVVLVATVIIIAVVTR